MYILTEQERKRERERERARDLSCRGCDKINDSKQFKVGKFLFAVSVVIFKRQGHNKL